MENDASPSKETENQTKLIVNYLPQSITQEQLHAIFAVLGEISNCKLVKDKKTQESLGYGFVSYKEQQSAEMAIEKINGLRIHNKVLKVSIARPSLPDMKDANLYISGLPKDLDDEKLAKICSEFGTVISCRVLYEKTAPVGGLDEENEPEAQKTSPSKGVAFVRFGMRSEAEKAAEALKGTTLEGGTTPLLVKFSNHANRKVRSPLKVRQPLRLITKSEACLHSSISNVGWCLFVYNLLPTTNDNILWQLFGPFGAVQSVRVIRNSKSRECKGYGFVIMTYYQEALNAVHYLNGSELCNRVLQVSFKTPKRKTPNCDKENEPGYSPL